jgi:hypothetical protein
MEVEEYSIRQENINSERQIESAADDNQRFNLRIKSFPVSFPGHLGGCSDCKFVTIASSHPSITSDKVLESEVSSGRSLVKFLLTSSSIDGSIYQWEII